MKLLVRGIAIGTAAVACGTLAGLDRYEVGDCKGGECDGGRLIVESSTGEPDGAGPLPVDEAAAPCPNRPGPESIRVGPASNAFCIDATEVSNEEYDRFLAANVDPRTQPTECAWNTSFDRLKLTDAGAEKLPAVGVDWCDALAYCTWAGKYLCGRVEKGKKTGPITQDSVADYKTHQWMLACSGEGRLRYPYGGEYDPTKCNLAELDASGALPVGSLAECIGGYTGMHDMIGNVWEWYDACRPSEVDAGDAGPRSDACLLKGGSYIERGAAFDCRQDSSNVRDFRSGNVGFRCCSE